jgi:hypothetical protein
MKISIKTLSVLALSLGLLGSVSSYAGSKDSAMIGIHPFDQEAKEQADQDQVVKKNENRSTASVVTESAAEDSHETVARADEEAGIVITPQFKGRNLH